jgi:hypothetical protein
MDCSTFSYDLHVLGTPPALILSQDQTLVCNLSSCRRVVGRTTIACFRSKGKRDGVTISQRVVTYLVRSLGLGPSHFSHDWHVQPSCQRPKSHFRLSGAFSGLSIPPGGRMLVLETFRDKPYEVTDFAARLSTHWIDRISTETLSF